MKWIYLNIFILAMMAILASVVMARACDADDDACGLNQPPNRYQLLQQERLMRLRPPTYPNPFQTPLVQPASPSTIACQRVGDQVICRQW